MSLNVVLKLAGADTAVVSITKPAGDVQVRLSGVVETTLAGEPFRQEPITSRDVTTSWVVSAGILTAGEKTSLESLLTKLYVGLRAQFPLQNGAEQDLS
jgi:hypothetical protein